jgi:hypothetical protein
MRKFVSLVFLSVLLWQFFGFVGYFEFSRISIRKEIKTLLKNGVDPSELCHFQYTPDELNQLNWVKDHEFVQEGNFYDVVRRFERGNAVYLECISDTKEKALFANLNQTVSSNLAGHDQPLMAWIGYLFTPFYIEDHERLDFFNLMLDEEKNFRTDFKLKENNRHQISPPPEQMNTSKNRLVFI